MTILVNRLEQLAASNHKVVVFSQFVGVIDILKGKLNELGLSYSVLTGRTKKRETAVETFTKDPSVPIFLVSLKAGGVGLNLNVADYAFIYDPWWNPAVEKQAMDRIHRLGQKKAVFVYRLLMKDSIEEVIHLIQNKKSKILESLLLKEGELLSLIDNKEMKDLFV